MKYSSLVSLPLSQTVLDRQNLSFYKNPYINR